MNVENHWREDGTRHSPPSQRLKTLMDSQFPCRFQPSFEAIPPISLDGWGLRFHVGYTPTDASWLNQLERRYYFAGFRLRNQYAASYPVRQLLQRQRADRQNRSVRRHLQQDQGPVQLDSCWGPSTQEARYWFTRLWARIRAERGLTAPQLPRV